MRGVQGPTEPSELNRGCLEPSGLGTLWTWNPLDLEPYGLQEKKGKQDLEPSGPKEKKRKISSISAPGHENGPFSVHSFNQHYLSIKQITHGIRKDQDKRSGIRKNQRFGDRNDDRLYCIVKKVFISHLHLRSHFFGRVDESVQVNEYTYWPKLYRLKCIEIIFFMLFLYYQRYSQFKPSDMEYVI